MSRVYSISEKSSDKNHLLWIFTKIDDYPLRNAFVDYIAPGFYNGDQNRDKIPW